ncbi:HlyD family type I secretion periplasmic adaptor subunit [Ancylobacter sp. SL191]|uniref:HlyD family type I secretion periplasmic adaptor subunit n=1 Tax=Ancylobacter sp. SL191 TaxID=2995166 RepID=UPI0022714120|nr:HlyD family type I secretion periplasmic adaptor subunit [Ancylobacter sp. SL191]WAC29309.1 HlyD family type I secretion periplasmic adaptor subunit [Ancylobacter sp. SL191]
MAFTLDQDSPRGSVSAGATAPSATTALADAPAKPPRISSDVRPIALVGYAVILLTFGLGGLWAVMAEIDSAVVAAGVVSVESRRQVVQHLEGGIIAEIAVKDGDRVTAGDLLFSLDPTTSRSAYVVQRTQLDTLLAIEARLQAEQTHAQTISFPAELEDRADDPAVRAVLNDQLTQFRDRKASLDSKIAILNSRAEQVDREIQGLNREREALDKQLFYIDDELDGISALSSKGLVSKPRLAELQRERSRLDGLVGRNTAEIAKAFNSVGEVKLQIQDLQQRQREEVTAQLVETRRQISDTREKLAVSENVLKRIDLRAPRAGIVQNINPSVRTRGAVVKPGETLLEIVPQHEDLIVDARVPTTDIDRLHDGVTGVEIRFPAFHSRTTPLILGQLQSVSPDRLIDEATQQPYFQAVVSIPQTDVPDDLKARLRPGMPAEVIFSTGERSVLSYLTRPLTDAFSHAMRDR